ncbi:hypothetical protein CSP5_0111 [Cuniculiplasma divulgatum]|uniref:Uncharacterized protein n=1 Tax=Cuniculiplasma divulgatum TaxID=1673428 RepID=A0A1N5S786_9ARCH|nr:MAG: hypothetical protein AMDU5_GPLC00004G0350 [Thermoplasmatales archaeon Gpl]SIM31931.1 hypothetical protein CSP5_0111 [Cuniculiplasma divulgatum]SJK83977.1 hypothetical protein CPM_0080 [Cuniculiplasma divulgatum]
MHGHKKILEVVRRNDKFSSICDSCVTMFKKHRVSVNEYLNGHRDLV